MSVWEYFGFYEVLKEPSNTTNNVIKPLHQTYRSLSSTPVSQQFGAAFQKKRVEFLESLSKLIYISNRTFLLHHWDTQISSTWDLKTKAVVEKKLAREAKYEEYDISQSVPGPFSIHTPSFSSTSPASNPDSSEKLLPKKPCRESCTPRSTGTTITVPTDIIKKIGPAADRLGASNNQLVATIATSINHCGEDIDDIALSKSTAR